MTISIFLQQTDMIIQHWAATLLKSIYSSMDKNGSGHVNKRCNSSLIKNNKICNKS
jgi:hypothetical protein